MITLYLYHTLGFQIFYRFFQVYIFGHVPPGIYERHYNRQALHWFQDRFNRKYLSLVQTYSDVIAGQFFGHAHTDSFRLIYDEYGKFTIRIGHSVSL